VCEVVVLRAMEDQVSSAELLDAPQALERLGVDDIRFNCENWDIAVHRVQECLGWLEPFRIQAPAVRLHDPYRWSSMC
jgi:hypothetical protein